MPVEFLAVARLQARGLEMNPFVGYAKPRIFVIRPALFKSALVDRMLPLTFHSGPRRRRVAVASC